MAWQALPNSLTARGLTFSITAFSFFDAPRLGEPGATFTMDALRSDKPNNLRQFHAGTGLFVQQSADQLGSDSEIADAEGRTETGEAEIELSLEQAAPLFQSVQIPVLVTQRVRHRSDFRRLPLEYPCHLRGPEGSGLGIAVTNRIDAIAACQTLMSRKVNGAFPESLLVEGAYDAECQLSLSMELDAASGEVCLRASSAEAVGQGSIIGDIAETTQTISPAVFGVEQRFAFARRLGLDASEQESLARLLEKLYILMTWAGLTRCCLDSLVVRQVGEAIALRGRLTFGLDSPLIQQAAAARRSGKAIHSEQSSRRGLQVIRQLGEARPVDKTQIGLAAKAAGAVKSIETERGIGQNFAPLKAHVLPPRVVRLAEGNIAAVGNGFSRTMAMLEQFQLHGGSAAAFVSLSQDVEEDRSGLDVLNQQHQLRLALQALARLPRIKVVLINWRSSHDSCRLVADTLVDYKRQLSRQGRCSSLSLVVRLVGAGAEAGYERLQGEEIAVEESLGGAIACSLGLARIGHS